MARINLLPWREEYRQDKKKEFLTQLAAVALFAAIGLYIWVYIVDTQISGQEARNKVLKDEIAILEKQVKEIEELKKDREQLVARMRVIQDLQGTRPTIVRYFDEMVRSTPDGIFFLNMKRVGDRISIEGITESRPRISALLRNLAASDWFSEPDLKQIRANKTYGADADEFSLEVKTVLPSDSEGEDE